MAPSGAQTDVQKLIGWVQAHPAWAAGGLAALYPAALVLRPLLITALPYVIVILGLATVSLQPQSCGLRMHYTGALIAWADCGFDHYFHSTHRPVCFCSLALEARRNSSNQVWCVCPACSAAMCAADSFETTCCYR